MAYTENKSIDWLTAITPTIDDLVVTMDQAEVWVAKSSTLLSVYNLFKTTYDTVYAKYLGDADFYKYSIVTSVGNLIVNNSFETDLTWWGSWAWANITRDTTEYYHWSASMKVDFTSNNWYIESYNPWKIWQKFVYSLYVKWTAGKKVELSAWYQWYPWPITLTGGWQRIVFSYISVNANNTVVLGNAEWSPHTIYVDAVQVEEWTLTAWPFTTTQWNLTVSLKNYEGNDPTPTKPVKIQIGGVIRTITSALTATINSGTNWFNAGSTELATKEIDYFPYLRFFGWYQTVWLFFSRYPSANLVSDFSASGTYTNEKYWSDSDGVNALVTDPVVNIGRFNATLSAGLAWSIPATSVIINSPCYETREFDMNIIPNWTWTITSIDGVSYIKYKLSGNVVKYNAFIRFNKWTLSGDIWFKLPFTNNKETQASWYVCSVIATTPYTSLWVRFAYWITKALKQSYTAELQWADVWTDDVFAISWSYTI